MADKSFSENPHIANLRNDITGIETISWGGVTEKIGKRLNKSLKYVSLPAEEFRKGLIAQGAPEVMQDAALQFFTQVSNGRFDYKNSVVKDVVGKPANSFDNWLDKNINIFK